jgi:hypothetical protein
MTSARPRTRIAGAVAVAALGLGLLVASPAQAVVAGPYALFANANNSYALYTGGLDGTVPSLVTTGGMVTNFVEASHDAQVIAIQGQTGTTATPLFDTTDGLIVSDQGVTHVLATRTDANPVVASDGSKVWFAANGDLYSWTRVGGVVTRLTTNGPLVAPTGQSLSGLAVTANGATAAGVFRAVNQATGDVTKSQVKAFTVATLASTVFTSTAYAGTATPELFSDAPRFANNTLYFGLCATGACDNWTYRAVDTSAVTPADVATAGALDNTYDLRLLDDGVAPLWYAWEDGPSVGSATYKTSTDLTTWNAGGTRSDAATALGFVPVDTPPVAFSALHASSPTAAVQPHLDLSAALVKTGGRPVFASYAFYLKPVGAQTWAADSGVTQRGVIQFSIDAGKSWHLLGATTSRNVVPWPTGGPDGNGRTQALTRNTWFRWTVPADVFVGTATTSPRLVRVSPTVKAKIVKSGSKRTVAGTVARIGGTAVLYKGTKKIATVKISAKGVYSFGKRVLARGTYRVVTLADTSWAAGSLTVKI